MFERLLGKKIREEEPVFWLHPDNVDVWEIANDLRGDFKAGTVTAFVGQIVKRKRFRELYRRVMVFADGANEGWAEMR